jgi:rRNA maturation endonuclease Nob1
MLTSVMADRYIIDTNVILQHPEVLSRTAGKKLVIPAITLKELRSALLHGVRGGVQEVISDAIAKGVHVAQSPPIRDIFAADQATQRISFADIAVAQLALDYAERMGKSAVAVVTDDRKFAEFLSSKGIASISSAQFLSAATVGVPDKEIEVAAKTIVAKQRLYVVYSFVSGVIGSLLGTATIAHIRFLVSTFSVWGTAIVLPSVGVGLFWYREHFRLSYGVFEFLVGLFTTYYVVFSHFSRSQLGVVEVIQILAGLYVMVRGLENVGKGVEGTRLAPLWKKLLN